MIFTTSEALSPVHVKLLDELRKRSKGHADRRPDKSVMPEGHADRRPDKSVMPEEFTNLACQLDILRPLVLALWRCAMVRNIVAGLLGIAAMVGGVCGTFHSSSIAAGLVLLVLGLRGLPGGVPWLEVKTKAGFYGQSSGPQGSRNQRIQRAMQAWLASYQPCPWQQSGELCTVLPWLINRNRGSSLTYERVWLEAEDGELFACDWVFPPSGFDPNRPVVVLLTGLAPSKHWTEAGGFIADAAMHLTARAGMTVIVLVARGTMDTSVKKNLFHGARVTDLRLMLLLVHDALDAVLAGGAPSQSKPAVFACGYSMGAIILANYCGQYGHDPQLCGAIHFSGIYDAVANMKFKYSAATWQAYLTHNLKTTFCTAQAMREAVKRGVDRKRIMSRHVESIVNMDQEFISVFNGYNGVLDYYRDLSVAAEDKWRAVSVPLLAVASRDDPITHCDSLRAEEFSAGNSNLLFLVTERGGHVGWPWGLTPWNRGWDFTNEAIVVFVESLLADIQK